jgi:phosphopantothenoylcysteine decarboxylase/phosphopantothenate--cysteine ligase
MSKKILITAGPTWVKIDEVRIITTVFTGNTGIYLARELKDKGYQVTLLLNSSTRLPINLKGIKVIPFKYFDDFRSKIIKELTRASYDIIIHSAAVSDYKLKKRLRGKIASGKKELVLKLRPAQKIIKIIRKLAKEAVLVQFKLEIKRKGLIRKAKISMHENKSDFVVANALEDLRKGYKAFILNRYNRRVISINSKNNLALELAKISKRELK